MAERILWRLTFKQLLLLGIGSIAVLFVLAYGVFEARKLIEGARITVSSPADYSAVGGPVVTITGTIQNAAFFTIAGKQVLSDEKGNFSYQFTPPPGIAIVELAAKDRFGRTTSKIIEINVLPECIENEEKL